MNIARIRRLFPVTKNWIYMNHAAVSPLSTRVVTAMNRFLHDQLANGAMNWKDWYETYAHARSLVARLIHASADEIAFVKNTSEGVSFVANGLEFARGDVVAIPRSEFPANVYPWLALRRRGVRIEWIPEREGRIASEDVRRALRKKPRVLAISSVEFLTGYRNDLMEIGRMCREFSVFFFVDGIQGLGAFPVDVQEAGIDALASDSKKWLIGPEGTGIFYCSRESMKGIRVTEHGWMSVRSPSDYFSHKLTYPQGALRFEPGSLNTAGIHGLVAALELVQEVGVEPIASRLILLTDRLVHGLRAKGYRVLSPRGPGEGSGIISFRHRRHTLEQIETGLRAAAVVGARREGYIRLSPHYYLTEEDIDRALDALP